MGLLSWLHKLFTGTEPTQSAPSAPSGWFMPTYDGVPICDWEPQIAAFKREGNYEAALILARGCMEAMTRAAYRSPENVMEFYVVQVLIIQRKMKDYAGEIATIEGWLAHGLPPTRQDHRLDIHKRLAKAREQLAKANGEDYSEHTKAWKEAMALQKQLKPSSGSVTGASRLSGGTSPTTSFSPQRRHTGWVAPRDVIHSPTFVAVDFETANKDKASACQIALVKVSAGVVVDKYATLLKPPPGCDHFEFTYLHGISANTVRRAPRWDEVAPQVAAFSAGVPMFAHNAPFDAGVWRSLDAHFGTATLPDDFFCTYRTAKQLVPGLPNYKLPTVTEALVPGFVLDHHDAGSDAEAAGLIVAALQKLT